MDASTAIMWARCALEDAMASDDNVGLHRLRFTQAYYELRRLNLREQRRARKAAKNLVMYRKFGQRPWNVNETITDMERTPHDVLKSPYRQYYTKQTMDHLREPSGFLDMSRRADALNDGTVSFTELRDELSRTVYKDVVSILSEPNAFLSKMTKRGK